MTDKKVWIVDDDPVFQMISVKIIQAQKPDYQIESYGNGQEALDALKECHANPEQPFPDVILLDLNMPELNGWGFLEAFQEFEEEIAHIDLHIVSSSIDPEDLNRAKQNKLVKDFVNKPLNTNTLQSIL